MSWESRCWSLLPRSVANSPSQTTDSSRLIDSFFRHESGKATAALARRIGLHNLQLAEDSVQEAILRALHTWPVTGNPANPSAWIMATARNAALDELRRKQNLASKCGEVSAVQQEWSELSSASLESLAQSEQNDEVLGLIFACCSDAVPANSQVILALRAVCGFSTGEISRAYFLSEDNVLQRLSRARKALKDAVPSLELGGDSLEPEQAEGVRQTLYQLFNEGYYVKAGDSPIKAELCAEAIRLGRILASSEKFGDPASHALLALMLLQASRLRARQSPDGLTILLQDQDRSLWDQGLIAEGLTHLRLSAAGSDLNPYHLQAAIAAIHATASRFEDANWDQISDLYDLLYEVDPSPVIGLNRAVAIRYSQGAEAAHAELQRLHWGPEMKDYAPYYTFSGEIMRDMGRIKEAAALLQNAMDASQSASEQEVIKSKLPQP